MSAIGASLIAAFFYYWATAPKAKLPVPPFGLPPLELSPWFEIAAGPIISSLF
jgi:hypothetical protein